MQKKKLKIGVLFGGKSAEHEVSINSANNVMAGLDKKKYEIVPIKIKKDGKFDASLLNNLDVVFPVLHGPFGEDGSMQGLLKLAGVPFVGPGVLGSAVGMDKEITKRVLRDNGIPIGDFRVFRANKRIDFNKIKKELGLPLFIKPANMGSSVGISKVRNEKEFKKAVKDAFLYDSKIIIEEFIEGREIECAVLGNEKPIASLPGEIIPNADFYSYESKYIDDKSICEIPAKLDKKTIKKIQELSVKTFQVLNCEGLSRVDFFIKKNGAILVNEINTIPGFTDISMYPKMWEKSGLPISKLLDKLIKLAMERINKEKKLKTSV
jgi:D-alanine-D-alanine ligase